MRLLESRFADQFVDDEESRLFLGNLLAAAREGHLCVKVGEKVDPWLLDEPQVIAELPKSAPVIRMGDLYYLERHWRLEEAIWQELQRLLAMEPISCTPKIPDLLEEQQCAIELSSKNNLSLITGGPGTGKTFTAKHILESISPTRVACAAPTGKAAGNLAEALCDVEVQTLHSMLPKEGWHPADLILVDEASMIDADMMLRLLRSVKRGARLILLGDADQLPPVESGGLFGDMVEGLPSHTVRLTRPMRTKNQSILKLAEAIRTGSELPEVEWVESPFLDGFQLLSPLREQSNWLNQQMFRKRKEGEAVPIMITRNDRELGLYNGDIGGLLDDHALFGSRRIPEFLLPTYELAYCLSVHKSQGSAFDRVIVSLTEGPFGRELLYTAVTRARESVAFFGERRHLEAMARRHSKRLSGLPNRLCTE